MSIVIEGLEEKYKIKLDRSLYSIFESFDSLFYYNFFFFFCCCKDCKMLKNKKFMGKINEQHIRVQSKPLIAEMNDSSSKNDLQNTSNSQEIK